MNLSDALGDWPGGGGGSNQSGQPANPAWPSQPSGNPMWPGGQGGGGAWPGSQGGGGGGVWPGGQGGGGGGAWPGGQGGGGGGVWPGGQGGGGGGAWPGGQGGGGAWPYQPGPGVSVAPQQNLAIPYHQNLPNGVYDKMLITISGLVKPNADKITVDLGTSKDVAFHFNPRFNESGKQVIVRNTCINKKWGKEERELPNFPFVQGQAFEIKIMCTNSCFKVAVNNSHLVEYKHRITDLRSVNKLTIANDLQVLMVNVETLP